METHASLAIRFAKRLKQIIRFVALRACLFIFCMTACVWITLLILPGSRGSRFDAVWNETPQLYEWIHLSTDESFSTLTICLSNKTSRRTGFGVFIDKCNANIFDELRFYAEIPAFNDHRNQMRDINLEFKGFVFRLDNGFRVAMSKSFERSLYNRLWLLEMFDAVPRSQYAPELLRQTRGLEFSLPIWFVLLATGGYPMWLLFHGPVRRWRRRRRNLCIHCGYNLTGNTTGKCSECGATLNSKVVNDTMKPGPPSD